MTTDKYSHMTEADLAKVTIQLLEKATKAKTEDKPGVMQEYNRAYKAYHAKYLAKSK